MKILFLTQIVPYPLDAGPKVKTWSVLRCLAERGHQITLVSFVRPEEEAYLSEFKKFCSSVIPVPIRRSRVMDIFYWIRSWFTGRPFLIERDDVSGMSSLVRKVLSEGDFDVVHADQFTMTQFAIPVDDQKLRKSPFRVFDAHNADWVILERAASSTRWYLKPLIHQEAKRLKDYEGNLFKVFDHILAVSEHDRKALLDAYAGVGGRNGQDKISVIPIAVNTNLVSPICPQRPSTNILTLGSMNYPPNIDGIRWFVQEVFPKVLERVPEATLTIIGKHPPKDFLALAHHHPGTYKVPGYVPDLTEWLEQAALMVVPVRAGGGMRVRILEAFARAVPVVTTTVGLEGIDADNGRDVLVADDAEAFAAEVVRLLQDPALQNLLASRSRELVERRYDWQVVLKDLDLIYIGILHEQEKGPADVKTYA